MQIIEGSLIGVRSARLHFRHPSNPLSVTLFPMIHIGEAQFYHAVFEDAFAHDHALTEGVNSPIVKRITRAYRWMLGSKTLDLVLQPRPPAECRATIVHADLTAAEFEAEWRKVALWLRLTVYVVAAVGGLWRRRNQTRQLLADVLTLDDAPSLKELVQQGPEMGALTHAILDARDQRLLERLGEQIDSSNPDQRSLAVVYGARHMRAVIKELTAKRGYSPVQSDWMTVFSL
ncbi:MAG: hypothetical protein ACXWKM_08410 [Phenylobacterium sp.]